MAMVSPTMGVYNSASQLGDDVAEANAQAAQTFGNYGPSLKDQLAIQRLNNSAMSPYMRSLYGARSQPLQDLSPSASWSEGLAKGAGNIMSGVYFRQNKEEQRQLQNDMMAGIQQQQQAAELQAQQAAQQHAAQRQHILERQGPDAAFAFDLSPKKFGESAGTIGGQMPFVAPHAQLQAFGTGLGQGQAHIANIQNENAYLQNQGVNFADANQGVIAPSAANLITRVTGDKPIDVMDANRRAAELQQAQQQAVAGTINNQTLAARNDNEVTGGSLRNQGQLTENQIKNIELGFKAANEKAALDEKYLTQQDKAAAMAKREAAERMIETLGEQMRQGKVLTPADASRLDQTFKAAGLDTSFLDDLKKIANPKGGKPLTNEAVQKATSGKGWVTLPSGKQYNPATHEVIEPGHTQQKPKKLSAVPQLNTGAGMPLTELLPG